VPLYGAALSPDGKMVVTACITSDGAKVWDTATGHLLRTLSGPRDAIAEVAFSPDSKWIVTANEYGADPRIKIWDIETGEVIQSISFSATADSFIRALAFSPTSKYLAASTIAIKVWDLQSGEMVFQGVTREPEYIEFLPDERQILLRDTIQNETGANIGEQGELWNILSQELVSTFEGDQAMPTLDGRRIFTEIGHSYGVTFIMWDVETGEKLRSFFREEVATHPYALSPDGEMMLLRNQTETKLANTRDGAVLRNFGNMGKPLSAHQAFSDDGRLMITVYGNTVYLWDISDLAAGVKKAEEYDKQE